MDHNEKIYVAGHNGMVGSALVRQVQEKGLGKLILRSRKELNLLNQRAVKQFFNNEQPDYVFLAAGRVGGIHANNTNRAQFIYENLQIQNNIIHYAHECSVKKLLFLGSSCIYPRNALQPIKEEYLLTGELEQTNEPYAIAKISGIKMCESYHSQYGCQFFSLQPANAYGPNDNYNLQNSHVLPALIRKLHEAKINSSRDVTIWGSGKPKREFIHVDDIAEACLFIIEKDFSKFYKQKLSHLNVGTNHDISIARLVTLLTEIIGYKGKINYDKSMPDGTPRKVMDVSRINQLGWKHKINLEEGLAMTYAWFSENFYKKNMTPQFFS